MPYKLKITDTHVFFLTGPYSQWHPTVYYGKLFQDGESLRFTHAEQYMMAAKALRFGDMIRYKAIMHAKHPWDQKALGRDVTNFSEVTWNTDAQDVVFRGNWYKFLGCPEYSTMLLNSGTRHLVEGNAKDQIWGVGLDWNDPAILDPANWHGRNWLGEAHMLVRHFALLSRQQLDRDPRAARFDPWTRTFTPS